MAITILPPGETIHQTEQTLVLENPNFPLEIIIPNAVVVFCGVMIVLMVTGHYDPQQYATEVSISPALFKFLAVPFLLVVAIALTLMQPVRTIGFDKQSGHLIITRSKWLGLRPVESRFPLSEITEVRLYPDKSSEFENRWTLFVMAGSEPFLRLPASSLRSNYSQEKAEAIATTIRNWIK